MDFAHIMSIENQHLYNDQKLIMILAHLVKKGLYNNKFINNSNQYVIMDNGAYENEQVSDNLDDLIDIALKNNIKVNEFVIPDIVNDKDATQKLFIKNVNTIYLHRKFNVRFMYVCQAKNIKELQEQINFINKFDCFNITVGISKLCPFNRSSEEAIKIYKTCKFPIHFLGLKDGLQELTPKIKQIIRSCDSNFCEIVGFTEGSYCKHGLLNYKRIIKNINLEKNSTNNRDVQNILNQFNKEVNLYV